MLVIMEPEYNDLLEKKIGDLVSTAGQDSFAPFFADRVMQRLRAERTAKAATLAESLAWLFYRTAPAALMLAVILFTYSVVNRTDNSQTLFESALGLPALTIEAAYSFDASYYALEVDESTAGRNN